MTIRNDLESLLKVWEERGRDMQTVQPQKAWQANGFKGYPKDYARDSSGIILRKAEQADIDSLRKRLPHEITFIEHGEKKDNCHAYTIAKILSVADLLFDIQSAERDARELLVGLREVGLLGQSESGDVVLYIDGYVLKHSGVRYGRRVRSKWGAGNVYEHGFLEVPVMYGKPQTFKVSSDTEQLEKFKEDFRSNLLNSDP